MMISAITFKTGTHTQIPIHKMISITEPTMIPEHSLIPGLIGPHDTRMLEASSSLDSQESDYTAIPHAAPIPLVANSVHRGIQHDQASTLRRKLLLGIIQPQEEGGVCQEVFCDSCFSVQSDSLHDFLASSPPAPATVVNSTSHHRSQCTFVGSDFLVNEY